MGASKPIDPATLQTCVNIYHQCGNNKVSAARALGIPRTTLNHRLKLAEEQSFQPNHQKPFTTVVLPDEDISPEELVEERIAQFERRSEAHTARQLIPIQILTPGPIGITHLGDPHIDDDGTDIKLIKEHVEIINKTEGMFGANLGDLSNNWIGRLQRLWAEQSTSARQAWKLTEWLVRSVDWLYLVGGNHDLFSGAGDPIQWMARHITGIHEPWGARIGLNFPNGKQVRVNARHDFVGHSMWNPGHGPMKAIQAGWRDHILTCGHKHTSFIGGPMKDPATGLLSWAIRCGGYKVMDRYQRELGLPDQNSFPAAVTIIDPNYADDDTRLITVIPSVHEGAEFLSWKRSRK